MLHGIKADLYLTGEMSHHEILFAIHQAKAACVLTEHSNSERGFLAKILQPRLTHELSNSPGHFSGSVFVSQADQDPVKFHHASIKPNA